MLACENPIVTSVATRRRRTAVRLAASSIMVQPIALGREYMPCQT